jgi:hypothetical protein
MDFFWMGLSTPDASLDPDFPSLNLMVFEILNLAAALYLLESSAAPEKLAVNRSAKYNSELAYTSAVAILDEIQTVGRKILKMSGTRSSLNLVRYLTSPGSTFTFMQKSPDSDDLGVVGARLRSASEKGHRLGVI